MNWHLEKGTVKSRAATAGFAEQKLSKLMESVQKKVLRVCVLTCVRHMCAHHISNNNFYLDKARIELD